MQEGQAVGNDVVHPPAKESKLISGLLGEAGEMLWGKEVWDTISGAIQTKKHAQTQCPLPGRSYWLPPVTCKEKWCCKGSARASRQPHFTAAPSIILPLSPFEFISTFLATTRNHHAHSSPWAEPHHPSPPGTCTFLGQRRG